MSRRIGGLDIGEKIKLGSICGMPAVWNIAGKDYFGGDTVTLVSERVIKLLAFDAAEPENSLFHRREYGNNGYARSNIRQWLNKDSAAGVWYTARHGFDAPPVEANVSCNAYAGSPGFLNGFTEAERAALLQTELLYDEDGSFTDKVFLLSLVEAGIVAGERAALPFFADTRNRVAKPSADAVARSEFQDTGLADGRGWYWWTREAYRPDGFHARVVNPDGSGGAEYAYCGFGGLRPACNAGADLAVGDNRDSSGAYTLIV